MALEWQARNQGKLNELEREFLAASQALKVREEEEREATHRRESDAIRRVAETERKARKRLQFFMVGLFALLIAAATVSVITYLQWQRLFKADMEAALGAHLNGDIERAQKLLNDHQSDQNYFRDFRWTRLWNLYHDELATLKGHASDVNSVAFSPDGKTLASVSNDQTIKLWDAQTRRELATLKGHAERVDSVAFSPDGKTLASGSENKTVKLRVGDTRQ